jgi:hypothetical protein
VEMCKGDPSSENMEFSFQTHHSVGPVLGGFHPVISKVINPVIFPSTGRLLIFSSIFFR